MFPEKEGSRTTTNRKIFSTVVRKAGIINFSFRYHDLKHTYVSQLIVFGVDIILNTYAHSSEARKQKAVKRSI